MEIGTHTFQFNNTIPQALIGKQELIYIYLPKIEELTNRFIHILNNENIQSISQFSLNEMNFEIERDKIYFHSLSEFLKFINTYIEQFHNMYTQNPLFYLKSSYIEKDFIEFLSREVYRTVLLTIQSKILQGKIEYNEKSAYILMDVQGNYEEFRKYSLLDEYEEYINFIKNWCGKNIHFIIKKKLEYLMSLDWEEIFGDSLESKLLEHVHKWLIKLYRSLWDAGIFYFQLPIILPSSSNHMDIEFHTEKFNLTVVIPTESNSKEFEFHAYVLSKVKAESPTFSEELYYYSKEETAIDIIVKWWKNHWQ